MIAGPPDIVVELEDALAHFHISARHLVLVSPLAERKGSRFAYRVENADGRPLKLRHVGTEAEARRVHALCQRLEDAFAPVLGQHGAVLLEAWIDGEALDGRSAEAWAADAGTLLGRLHATPLEAGCAPVYHTQERRAGAQSDLDILQQAGVLSPTAVGALSDLLCTGDPGAVPSTLVHNDFCAENMVVDSRGQLRVIDNEYVGIGAAGYDLGRTFDRWPMSATTWARFLGGYTAQGGALPAALPFWSIAATLRSARVHLQRQPRLLATSLALLGRLAAGNPWGEAPPP